MLNLLPWRQLERSKTKLNLLIFFIASWLGVCLVTYTVWQVLLCKRQHLLLRASDLRREIIKLSKLHERLEKKYQVSLQQAQQLDDKNSQVKVIGMLEKLREYIPENLYLTSMLLTRKSILIEGVLLSSSQEALKKFVDNIKQRERMIIGIKKIDIQAGRVIFVLDIKTME